MTQHYEIRLKGYLDKSWADWLGGLAIIHEESGETLLSGSLADQAALYGVLNQLSRLGIQLISVNPDDVAQTSGEDDADE